MKFFITIKQYGKENGDPYAHLGSAYGPYPDEPAIRAALERLWPNKESVEALVFDAEIITASTLPPGKPERAKREPGNMKNYTRQNGEWICWKCGVGVLGAIVWRPITTGNGHNGNGEMESIVALYCPNCETKPEYHPKPDYEREPIFSE